MGRRGAAAPLGGLLLLTALLFWPALFAGRVFWYRDIGAYWTAQAESFVRVIASGAPPLWNPYVSFGLPMLADPSYQIAYPMTWLNLVLRPETYYTLYVVLHTLLAGAGLYALADSLALERVSATLAAALWICSGPFLSLSSHAHHFAGAALIPWVLFGLERALARRTLGRCLQLGGIAALQVLAGSGDVCLMTAFAALGYAAIQPGARAGLRGTLPVVALSLLFALSLSAVQWLPTVAILGSGARPGLPESVRLYWSVHPVALADVLVPSLLSDLPWNQAARAAIFDGREPFLASVYLGAGAALLVATGLAGPWSRARGYAGVGFVLALTAALGRHTPLYGLLARATPLGLLRYPAKFMILAALYWALLAGLAAGDWLRAPSPRRRRLAAVGAAVLAVPLVGANVVLLRAPQAVAGYLQGAAAPAYVALASLKLLAAGALVLAVGSLLWFARGAAGLRPAALAVLVALVAGDVAFAGHVAIPFAPAALLRARPRVAELVPPGSRIYSAVPEPSEQAERNVVRVPAGWLRVWASALGNVELVRPPSGARWGLFGSYDGDFTGLAPLLLSNLTLIVENAEGTALGERLLRLGGVDYLVGTGPAWPGLEPVAQFESVFAAPVSLWRVPDALPRAFVVTGARPALEPEAVELLAAPDFDPAREAVLAAGASRVPPAGTGRTRVLEERADRASYAVEMPAPGWLVVLETFHPGWRASVDGRPVDVLRADVLFRAVAVPAGRHLVTLAYRPNAVYAGVALTGIGLLAAIATLAIASRAKGPPP